MNNTNLKSVKKENSYTFNPINISNTLNSIPNSLKNLIYGEEKTKSKIKTQSENILTQSLNSIPKISSSLKESKLPIDTIISPNTLSKSKTNITLSIPNNELTKYTNELSKISPLNISTQNINDLSKSKNKTILNNQQIITELTPIETLEQELITIEEKEPNSFLSLILNISLSTWIIIILILALLGINIFTYLEQGTEFTSSLLYKSILPFLEYFGLVAKETTKQITTTTETGVKTTLDKLNLNKNSKNEKIQETQPTMQSSTLIYDNTNYQEINNIQDIEKKENEIEIIQKNALEKALNDSKVFYQQERYKADNTNSEIQSSNKRGWCFIGVDNGIRNCSKIGVNDTCMSGKIYPSQEICINPNLRM